jgi:hypothetical protein
MERYQDSRLIIMMLFCPIQVMMFVCAVVYCTGLAPRTFLRTLAAVTCNDYIAELYVFEYISSSSYSVFIARCKPQVIVQSYRHHSFLPTIHQIPQDVKQHRRPPQQDATRHRAAHGHDEHKDSASASLSVSIHAHHAHRHGR